MEGQPPLPLHIIEPAEEPLAEVIELEQYRSGIETIDGRRVHLAKMSLEGLEQLHDECDRRISEAQTDRWVVEQFMETAARREGRPLPDNDGGAA